MDWGDIKDRIRSAEHPVSLCEVIEENEFAAIAEDVQSADSYRSDTDFYLKLLCAGCYVARQEAREGEIWPIFYDKLGLPVWVRDELFNSKCVPKKELYDHLQDVCIRWNLRHVFYETGDKEVQRWYGSISLQFGFILPGFSGHLPEWLMGYSQPVAIERLRDHPTLQSESFRRLWKALEDYREGMIPADGLRQVINRSPWVLEEWADDIINVVASRHDISRREGYRFIRDQDDESLSIVSKPKLNIERGLTEAHWQFHLKDIEDLSLTEDIYQLNLIDREGESLAETVFLRRKNDGSYTNDEHEFLISFDEVPDGKVFIKVIHGESNLVHQEEIALFDLDEDDIIAFKTPGSRIKNFTKVEEFRPGAYILMLRDDLTISPAPTIDPVPTKVGYKLYRINFEESQELCIVFEDDSDELWSSKAGYNRNAELPDNMVLDCSLLNQEEIYVPSCESIFLEIVAHDRSTFNPSEEIQITSAKWRNHALDGEYNDHWMMGSIPKIEALRANSVKIWVRGTINEKSFRDSVVWEPNVTGIFEGKSTFTKSFAIRTIGQLDKYEYRYLKPTLPDGRWELYEGKRYLQNDTAKGVLPKSGYLGLGQKLILRRMSPDAPKNEVTFINQVVDSGIFIPSANTPQLGKDFEFNILRLFELGSEHQIHYGILGDSPIVELANKRLLLYEDKGLFAPFPETPCDYLILSFRGDCVASWWSKNWSNRLREIEIDGEARKALSTILWGKLPFLSEDNNHEFYDFLERFPHIFLRTMIAKISRKENLGILLTSLSRGILRSAPVVEYISKSVFPMNNRLTPTSVVRKFIHIGQKECNLLFDGDKDSFFSSFDKTLTESLLQKWQNHPRSASIQANEIKGFLQAYIGTDGMSEEATFEFLKSEWDIETPLPIRSCPTFGVTLLSAQWKNHQLVIKNDGDAWDINGFPIDEVLCTKDITIELSGKTLANTFKTSLTWHRDVAEIIEDEVVSSICFLSKSIGELKHRKYHVIAPSKKIGDCIVTGKMGDWEVREGSEYRRRCISNTKTRLANSGYFGIGQELLLDGLLFDPELVVIRELVDQGIFSFPSQDLHFEGPLKFDVLEPISLTDEHRTYFGILGGMTKVEPAKNHFIIDGKKGIFVPSPEFKFDYWVLYYHGKRLSTWWRREKIGASWSSACSTIHILKAAREAAFTMRWARLPVLSPYHKKDVQLAFNKFPNVFRNEWKANPHNERSRKLPDDDNESWEAALAYFSKKYRYSKNILPHKLIDQ